MSTLNPFKVSMERASMERASMERASVPSDVPDPVTGGVYRYDDGVWYECLGKRSGLSGEVHFRFGAADFEVGSVRPLHRYISLTAQDWQQQHARWTKYTPAGLSPRNRAPTQIPRKTTPPR